MPSMTGTFKLISSENFDEYLKAIGVSQMLWEIHKPATLTTQITNENDEWDIKTITTFNTSQIKFKLWQEFVEITDDGRVCKSVITQEGQDKLVHIQNYNDIVYTIVREFSDTEMKMTLDAPVDIVATRTFQRQ